MRLLPPDPNVPPAAIRFSRMPGPRRNEKTASRRGRQRLGAKPAAALVGYCLGVVILSSAGQEAALNIPEVQEEGAPTAPPGTDATESMFAAEYASYAPQVVPPELAMNEVAAGQTSAIPAVATSELQANVAEAGLSADLAAPALAAGLEAPAESGKDGDATESLMSGAEAEALAIESAERAHATLPRLVIRAGGSAIYDDNTHLSSSDPQSDFILQTTAGFTWNPLRSEQRRFKFNYDATANFYTEESDRNGVDHIASLDGYLDLAKTRMELAASFAHLTGVDAESREFQDRNLAVVSGSFEQELTAKLTLRGGANYNSSIYDTLQSTEGFSARLGLTAAVTAKAWAGLAAVAGSLDSDSTGKQDYQSLLVIAGYEATGKLKLNAEAGIQKGQTTGSSGGSDDTHFVFSMDANYQVREKTALKLTAGMGSVSTAVLNGSATASDSFLYSLNASHRLNDKTSVILIAGRSTPASDIVSNASIERTGVSLAVNRKLGSELTLEVGGGYESSDYIPTEGDVPVDRQEDAWFLRSVLAWKPGRSANVGLYYEFRDVSSNPDDYSYQHNRVGLTMGYSW